MFKFVDELLDRFSMYRLLLYYLIGLVLVAVGLSAAGVLHMSAIDIAGSAIYLTVICWIINQIFARFLKLPVNSDSTYITALILALIITPNFSQDGFLFLSAAASLAIASKYLITYKKRHIFNPAGIAIVLTALGPQQSASWWIGTSVMMPFVLAGGLLLVRRIRRGAMVSSFLGTALLATVISAAVRHVGIASTLHQTIFSSSLLFLAFVMFTEPLTSPSTRKHQVWYGVLTGLLFPPQIHLGSFYSTPERALSVGNIFAFIVNPKVKLMPALTRKEKITQDSMDFVFAPDQKFAYEPGQYMDFTLPHRQIDSRGQRRYFTLASSPTEDNIRIGVKFYQKNGSSFKKAMLAMDKQTPVIAANLGGDFTLPRDASRKLVFIAGGIGITPFRSMLKYLLDKDEKRDATLLYGAATTKDIAYADIFSEAHKRLGTKVRYVLSSTEKLPDARFRAGRITPELLKGEVADLHNSLFYISGPHAMVVDVEHSLRQLGVSRTHIKTDFFSGYS